MYPKPRKYNYDKRNMVDRWNLTERVFFACGACHILAYAFLKRYAPDNGSAIWVQPKTGYIGKHIFVEMGNIVFDYHGYSDRDKFLIHMFKRAKHY